MKHFSCGDVVPGSAAVFIAPTDDELFTHIGDRALTGHGTSELSPELVTAAKQHTTAA